MNNKAKASIPAKMILINAGGGCMIALTKPESLQKIAEASNHAGEEAFIMRKTMERMWVEE